MGMVLGAWAESSSPREISLSLILKDDQYDNLT